MKVAAAGSDSALPRNPLLRRAGLAGSLGLERQSQAGTQIEELC
jgi:hypothetical protein